MVHTCSSCAQLSYARLAQCCVLEKTSSSYSCNNITTTLIQISSLFYFGFFSKTNHRWVWWFIFSKVIFLMQSAKEKKVTGLDSVKTQLCGSVEEGSYRVFIAVALSLSDLVRIATETSWGPRDNSRSFSPSKPCSGAFCLSLA